MGALLEELRNVKALKEVKLQGVTVAEERLLLCQ
jgi:hypothetical protein